MFPQFCLGSFLSSLSPLRVFKQPDALMKAFILVPILLLSFLPEGLSAATPPIKAKQGEAVALSLKFEPGVSSVQGIFLNQKIPFFKKSKEEFLALIGIDMAQSPGPQPFEVIWRQGEEAKREAYVIDVIEGAFGTEAITLPKEMVDLDPPALVRVEDEKAQILRVFSQSEDQKGWEGRFLVPVAGKILGTFGFRRMLNGQLRNQHSGEDIGAPLGTPVLASNDGKIVLVGDFYFNGHSVVIDHGMGLFTMYFHLLGATVKEGDSVSRGETIGFVGKSGRATGPHLHWGARLNGARVNPFSLISSVK